jgi:hypothetical protein
MASIFLRCNLLRLLLFINTNLFACSERTEVECDTRLEPILRIKTNAAAGWKHFNIMGKDFLAVANFWDGVPEHRMKALSVLYSVSLVESKDGPLKLKLKRIQDFETVGAHGWEFAESGNRSYLVVPNYYQCGSDRGPASDSCKSTAIYTFDSSRKRFVEHQRLSTAGPASVTAFRVDDQLYLVVGENFDDKVSIFREEEGGRFVVHQKLPVAGAGVSAFLAVSPTRSYLVAASYHDPRTRWITRSVVFRWQRKKRSFTHIRDLPTAGAHHVEPFSWDEEHTGGGPAGGANGFFVANDRDDHTTRVLSPVYSVAANGSFRLVQEIPTDGAHGAALMRTRGGQLLLAVANFGDRLGKRYTARSAILARNASGLFHPLQEVDTLGATDWEAFRIGPHDLFVVSNEGADGAATDSVFYHVVETCRPGSPGRRTEL